MPLAPAPIVPGTSPLPPPGQRPPDRRALRVGALVALPLLVVSLVLGQLALPRLLFLTPGLQAQAGGREPGVGAAPFQGFVFWWTRRMATGAAGGGYTTPASLQNLRLQANTFHMNAVIIPVVADMPRRSEATLTFASTDTTDKDTLTDADYDAVINDARKAGLLPILELVVRQQDPLSGTDGESSQLVGKAWHNIPAAGGFGVASGKGPPITVGPTERAWFDQYTNFAVHYAQLSRKHNLPYFIIGDRLSSVSFDTDHTKKIDPNDPKKLGDPGAVDSGLKSDPFINSCTGRRDCEWRHVINAIKTDSYGTFVGHKAQPGAQYGGKLIYAADWTGPGGTPEFAGITWWDSVDYIGVDAYFPLTAGSADLSVEDLSGIWHNQGDNSGPSGDVVGQLGKVADKALRPVLFTSAGYESVPGSNATPGDAASSDPDPVEQKNDMEALAETFNNAPWWAGVFWYAEEPITPHSAQANWSTSTAWAGDTLDQSKLAGQWLASYYKSHPLPCDC